MGNQLPLESQDSSLYFHSTQIQARYEDQEHHDTKLSQLQKFKNTINAPKLRAPKPVSITKPKPKPKRSKQKNTRQINSISAFVRETLGGKKTPDSQTLLDQFMGDQKKLDDFLSQVQRATKMPHLLSKTPQGTESNLISGTEWKMFSKSLRLRFPNLSKTHKKTLKAISRRLDNLRQKETEEIESQGSNTNSNTNSNSNSNMIWSQASRQPSNELTKEQLKWLYDIDDESTQSDSSVHHNEQSLNSPTCLTLSQAVDDRNHIDAQGMDSLAGNDEFSQSQFDEDASLLGRNNDSMENDLCPELKSLMNDKEPLGLYPDQGKTQDSESESCSSEKSHCSIPVSRSYTPAEDFIPNSETEPEPFSESELSSFLAAGKFIGDLTDSTSLFGQKGRFPQPWNPEQPFSVTTSLVFASKQERRTQSQMTQSPVISPIKSSIDMANKTIMNSLTPTKSRSRSALNTPSCLRIDSSPVTSRKFVNSSPLVEKYQGPRLRNLTQGTSGAEDDIFLSANASFPKEPLDSYYDASDSESLQFSPLKKMAKPLNRERIEVEGRIELDPTRSTRIQLTVIPSDRQFSDDVIPDSEEDPEAEISIIEVSKQDVNPDPNNTNTSVLQVPSSPEVDQIQRPWERPI